MNASSGIYCSGNGVLLATQGNDMAEATCNPSGVSTVVLANTHNPTIASRDWLVTKGVFTEPEFEGFEKEFVHTPVAAMHETTCFTLQVDQARLQIRLKDEAAAAMGDLPEKTCAYIKGLPETPYKAVGMNFAYRCEFGSAQALDEFVRAAVFNTTWVLLADPELTPARLGFTMTVDQSRRRLTIKVAPDEANLTIDINFHYPAEGASAVCSALGDWEECREYADDLASRLVAAEGD